METTKNRRTKYLFIRPARQWKFALAIAATALMALVIESVLVMNFFSSSAQAPAVSAGSPEQLVAQAETFVLILGAMLGLCLISVFFTIVVALFYGDRFFGPMVPFLRQIDALKRGDYSQRVKLRKNDELTELMMALNELAVALQTQSDANRK